MKTTQHTPLEILEPYTNRPTVYPLGIPWPEGNVHDIIGEITRKDRAQFIVTACNWHDEAKEALTEIALICEQDNDKADWQDILRRANSALEHLAKAQGKE